MTIGRNSQRWKRWVSTAVVVVLLLDGVLFAINWRSGQMAPQNQRDEAAKLKRQADLLTADITRAEALRRHLPDVRKNCAKFYSEQFLAVASGYSSVVSDLGELAGHAGLKTSGVSFRQKAVEKRGVVEVEISAAVEGDYPSLIHFINGLERSTNFYLLNNLTLASATTGGIKLQLELRTYFRS